VSEVALEHNPDLIFSQRESHSIPDMVSAGETVVVCGTWQYGTVMRYSTTVGPTGCVVFIEANPANVQRLSGVTSGMEQVTWINKAVWSEPADLKFIRSTGKRHSWDRVIDDKLTGEFPYDGKFPYGMVPGSEEIAIKGDTIDNILESLGIYEIDHLNLTVNRAEFEALHGARKTIANSRMRLRLNCWQSGVDTMIALLVSMGFMVHINTDPQVVEWQKGKDRYRLYAVKGN